MFQSQLKWFFVKMEEFPETVQTDCCHNQGVFESVVDYNSHEQLWGKFFVTIKDFWKQIVVTINRFGVSSRFKLPRRVFSFCQNEGFSEVSQTDCCDNQGVWSQVISRSPPTGNCAGAKPLRAREPHQPYSSRELYAGQTFLFLIFLHKQN